MRFLTTLSAMFSVVLSSALHAEPKLSTVEVQVKVPGAPHSTGVKVWLSGAAFVPGMNEGSATDSSGRATMYTLRTSHQYVLARRKDCDLTLGGSRKNLSIGGEWQVFQRGRLDLRTLGTVAAPDFFFNLPTGSGGVGPGPHQMRRKTPGKARFMFCAEDSEVLRRTFAPDHQPQPVGKVFVTGSWNNFNPVTEDVDPVNGAKELVDDGSFMYPDGDDQIGDGVFSRVLDLPPGDHTYVFMINGDPNYMNFKADPYEEGSRKVNVRRIWKLCYDSPGFEQEVDIKASVISVTKP